MHVFLKIGVLNYPIQKTLHFIFITVRTVYLFKLLMISYGVVLCYPDPLFDSVFIAALSLLSIRQFNSQGGVWIRKLM